MNDCVIIWTKKQYEYSVDRNKKAYATLQELEEQNVIKILEDKNEEPKRKASSFRGGLNLTEEQYKNF